MRTNLGAVPKGSEPEEIDRWFATLDPGLGDDMLSVLGVGEVIHLGAHDWEGMSQFSIENAAWQALVGSLRSAAEFRWPLTIHAILDGSVGCLTPSKS